MGPLTPRRPESLQERAQRASKARFQAALREIPAATPEPVDRSPVQAFRGQGRQGGAVARLLADLQRDASLER